MDRICEALVQFRSLFFFFFFFFSSSVFPQLSLINSLASPKEFHHQHFQNQYQNLYITGIQLLKRNDVRNPPVSIVIGTLVFSLRSLLSQRRTLHG